MYTVGDSDDEYGRRKASRRGSPIADLDARVKEIEKMARERRTERDGASVKPGAVAVSGSDDEYGTAKQVRKYLGEALRSLTWMTWMRE